MNSINLNDRYFEYKDKDTIKLINLDFVESVQGILKSNTLTLVTKSGDKFKYKCNYGDIIEKYFSITEKWRKKKVIYGDQLYLPGLLQIT